MIKNSGKEGNMEEIVNFFNEYFNIGTELAAKIDTDGLNSFVNTTNSLFLAPTNENEIKIVNLCKNTKNNDWNGLDQTIIKSVITKLQNL